MENQRHLFQLPTTEHYLNCAYMSPLLRSVEAAGTQGLAAKRNPAHIQPADFFEEAVLTRRLFGELVNAPADQVAIIPSVSYGMANAINNCPPKPGGQALIAAQEFPSDYIALKKWCTRHNQNLVSVPPPAAARRGQAWNEALLAGITADTSVVLLSHTHWVDGTLFNLQAIGQACRAVEARLLVDGTQSVGALPLDVADLGIDALICAGYKWLMGPYSIGLAYYSPHFNAGTPIEESWMNRRNAREFRHLTDYTDEYLPGAARYQVGEHSNFILLPMLRAALTQLLAWQPQAVQTYCRNLTQPLIQYLQNNGFGLEAEGYRAHHLFGFRLPAHMAEEKLYHQLEQRRVKLSVRGSSVRVSPHVYNTEQDIAVLLEALEASQT